MTFLDERVPTVWLDESGAHCSCGWLLPLTPATAKLAPADAALQDIRAAEIHTEYCTLHINHLHERIDRLPDALGEPVPASVLTWLHGVIRHPVVHIRRELHDWINSLEDLWAVDDEADHG